LEGVLKLLGSTRTVNPVKGLYDYRQLGNVHVISASGVGGGSLVYSNVTERPPDSVYFHLPTQKNNYNETLTSEFFDRSESFIGVNNITTTAGLGGFKLSRSRVFQEAANSIYISKKNILNDLKRDSNRNLVLDNNGRPMIDFDAKLSITDIEHG